MNFHAVQFQYSLLLIRLTYSEFLHSPDSHSMESSTYKINFVPSCIEFLNIIVTKSGIRQVEVPISAVFAAQPQE